MIISLDFETFYSQDVSLAKMPLRRYLEQAPVIGFSFSVDLAEPQWVPVESADFLPTLAEIDEACQSPENVLVAYNIPFDARVMRFGRIEVGGEPLGCRWPARIHDAMELSMASWPNQMGGYSLRNVASWLHLPPKLSMDDVLKGRTDWQSYCNRDCFLLNEIYKRALERIPPDELRISEMANRLRGQHYIINASTVSSSLAAFTANAKEGVAAAVEFLSSYARDGEDLGASIFGGYGEGDGTVRSVKAKALKDLLIGVLGFDTTSTSLKKVNPAKLAERPDVAKLLTATSQTNKGLYYQKRAQALVGVTEVDMELGYFRATNTGRYSAPTTGKGINKQNLSKKDKKIAKPLRQMLELPDNLCYVRADAANVEYRVEALLTGCKYVSNLFAENIEADPYGAFGKAAFGVDTKKGEPLRDVVCKAAVLGYGYGMGKIRAMEEMAKAVADPINKVSVQQIEALCHSRGWRPPTDRYLKGGISRVKCHWSVGMAAYEAREAFHALHPEFFAVADWLMQAVSMLAASKNPEWLIDRLYLLPGAPRRDMIDLSIDKALEFPTVRARMLNHSMPTVTWRHLSCSHPGVDGLGAVTANKGPRNVHRALLIENVTQSAARNMLVRAKLELDRRGWGLVDSVHDEILLLVPRERSAILQARADLLEVMSPRGPLGFGWAFYAKPSEVTVTRTMWESEEESKIAWAKLEANDPTWKEHLT